MRSFIFFLLLCLPLCGHNDVTEEVATLTEAIERDPSAELYYRRAVEFRALREKGHAISDLRVSLQLEVSPAALAALAELLSDQGKNEEALQLGERLTKLAPAPQNFFLLAQLAHQAGDHPAALRHLRRAPQQKDATHLLHAYLLSESGDFRLAAGLLKKAHQNTESIVLRNAWIDAAISAGDRDGILPILDEEIATSRYSASHRIRRARLLLEKDPKRTHRDLALSLAELNARIKPDRPDLTLINDRGLALFLSGDRKSALRDLRLLQERSLPASSYAQLSRLLRQK